MFAFLPPPGILNGWLCFVVTLCGIGVLTALVGDAAAIFGCLINLKDSITAIRFLFKYFENNFEIRHKIL